MAKKDVFLAKKSNADTTKKSNERKTKAGQILLIK